MSERAALRRLTTFLHLLAAALFAGTIGELIAAKHYESTMQFVPFALCGLGLLALLALQMRPTRPVVLAIRALMIVTAGGSLLGIYEHDSYHVVWIHAREDADIISTERVSNHYVRSVFTRSI